MYSTGNYYLLISEAWLDHQQKESVKASFYMAEIA